MPKKKKDETKETKKKAPVKKEVTGQQFKDVSFKVIKDK